MRRNLSDNLVYGGGVFESSSDTGFLVAGAADLTISRNRFDSSKDGIGVDGSGAGISENLMGRDFNGIISTAWFDDIEVWDSKIFIARLCASTPGWRVGVGVAVEGASRNSSVTHNRIEGRVAGAIRMTAHPAFGSSVLVLRNLGVDVGAIDFPAPGLIPSP